MSLFSYVFRDEAGDIIGVRQAQEYVLTGEPGGYMWMMTPGWREPRQVFTSFDSGNAVDYPRGPFKVDEVDKMLATQTSCIDQEVKAVAAAVDGKAMPDRESVLRAIAPYARDLLDPADGEPFYVDAGGGKHPFPALD